MARGTAAKSATGAAMSKYDVEVEKRLTALEANANTPSAGGDAERLEAMEKKFNRLLKELKSTGLPLDFDDLTI